MDDEMIADLPLWGEPDAYEILCDLCETYQIDPDDFRDLVAIERRNQHRERARGIYDEFDAVFSRVG